MPVPPLALTGFTAEPIAVPTFSVKVGTEVVAVSAALIASAKLDVTFAPFTSVAVTV